MIRTILCICIGVVFLLVTSVAAKEAKPSSSSAGPYCGIYCVYAALRAVGISTDFAQLTASEYVGSHQGSSAIELQAAIRNAGGDAKIVSGMSADGLWKRAAYLLTALLFAIFASAQLLALSQGLKISCGCYGAEESLEIGSISVAIALIGCLASLIGAVLTHSETLSCSKPDLL